MKKKIYLIMMATMALGFAACGKTAEQPKEEIVVEAEDIPTNNDEEEAAVEANEEEATVEANEEEATVEANEEATTVETNDNETIANPWTTSDKQGVLEATGFSMEAPEGATDVDYSYMADGMMAQLTYVCDGAEWVYRIQPAEALTDISGMNYTWIFEDAGSVSGMEAKYMGYSEAAEDAEFIDDLFCVQVVNWYDDVAKATYSLSVSGNNINGLDIQVSAENLYSNAQ